MKKSDYILKGIVTGILVTTFLQLVEIKRSGKVMFVEPSANLLNFEILLLLGVVFWYSLS